MARSYHDQHKDWGPSFLVLAVIGVILYAYSVIVSVVTPDPVPRLIGINCAGSGGDLWAVEESDFPTQCERIEKWTTN